MRREIPKKTIQLSAIGGSGYYDAASTTSESDFGAYAGGHEDTFFSTTQRNIAVARTRREVRNNPFLAALYESYPILVGLAGFRSRRRRRAESEEAEAFWRKWKKSVTRAGDDLDVIQAMRLREDLVAGEQFAVKYPTGKIKIIASEFCGSPQENFSGQPISESEVVKGELNGVIYDAGGAAKAYRFGRLTRFGGYDYAQSVIVPARYVIHDFDRERVLQGRGLPLLLASLKPARDLYEICRAKTKQIKDANVISGVIETTQETNEPFRGLQTSPLGSDGSVEAEGGDAPAPANNEDPIRIELKNGSFISLLPGEKLNALKTEYNASDYKELVMLMLHAIAAPVGLPVEFWFSGLGDINFSGFKGLGAQWNARRQWIKQATQRRFLDPLRDWRIPLAVAGGDIPAHEDFVLDRDCEWRWRKTAVLDEEREATANKKKYDTGEAILSDTWEENGEYPEEVFERRRQTYVKMLIAAGQLAPETAPETVEVPLIFLWRGKLPDELNPPAPVEPLTQKTDASTSQDD